MRRVTLAVMALAVLVLVSSVASAQMGRAAKDETVYARLDETVVSFTFNEQPLEEAINFLQTLGNINIVLDRKQVEAGKTITLKLTTVPMRTAVKLITEQIGLKWTIRDGVVFISDDEGVKQEAVTVVHDVSDLLAQPPDYQAPDISLQDINNENTSSGSGSGGSSSGGGLFGSDDEAGDESDEAKKSREELLQELVDLIKAVIEPGTWEEGG